MDSNDNILNYSVSFTERNVNRFMWCQSEFGNLGDRWSFLVELNTREEEMDQVYMFLNKDDAMYVLFVWGGVYKDLTNSLRFSV